jgi:hypothetical protein
MEIKTTKQLIHDNCIISIKQKDGRTKAMIHFIDINPETINNKWVRVNDVRKRVESIEMWFKDWYDYSWNNNSQEIVCIKSLLNELKFKDSDEVSNAKNN